jgi:hypothetical protein
MLGLKLAPIVGIAGLLAVVGAFIYGFQKGKYVKQLEWDSARAVLLEQKAEATRQRDQAIADADTKEKALSDELDRVNAENEDKLRDALTRAAAANAELGSSLFCVDDDVDRLFSEAVGRQHGSEPSGDTSPCKARVLPLSEGSSTN